MNPNDIQSWVSVKQFQGNIYEFLDKLPVVITKHGKPFAYLLPISSKHAEGGSNGPDGKTGPVGTKERRVAPVMGIKPIEDAVSQIQEKKGVAVCKHGRQFGLCEFGCK